MSSASQEAIGAAVEVILDSIGEKSREGLVDTPNRVARMYLEMTAGLREKPPKITTFEKGDADQMITILDIDYWSLCVPSKQHVNAVDGSKPASAVRVGDKLWTLADGRAVETTVEEVRSHKTRELVRVTTSAGVFEVTPDHPFATEDGWVEAEDLFGKRVEWTNARSLCRRRFAPKFGHSFGYVLGAVFSDGTVGDRNISLVVNDLWFAKGFVASLDEAFGIEADIEPVTRPSGFTGEDCPGFRVRVVSSYLADLFRAWAGGDAHHMKQRFPRVVLNSRDTMQGFIDGYVDGDGSRRKDRDASVIVSGNCEFLEDMAEAIDARFTPATGDSAHRLYVSDYWDQVGWFGKHGFQKESHRTDLVESCWVEVESVERLEASGPKPYTVYSFKCTREPTFLIQGHLSHNCEHHLVPFYGKVHVGYIPGDRIAGLSKFGRVVDHFAKRPQIQEVMTNQIVDLIMERLSPVGVIVVVEGTHLCMAMRGVKKPGHVTVTSAIRGDMAKNEFFDILKMRSR